MTTAINVTEKDTLPLLITSEDVGLNYQTFEQQTKKPRNAGLGLIMGVLVPCILSIFGAILFLRIGKITGEVHMFIMYCNTKKGWFSNDNFIFHYWLQYYCFNIVVCVSNLHKWKSKRRWGILYPFDNLKNLNILLNYNIAYFQNSWTRIWWKYRLHLLCCSYSGWYHLYQRFKKI